MRRGSRRLGDFGRTFVRKYVRADLEPGDRFLEPSPYGLPRSRPEEFLRAGSAGRIAEIVYRTILLALGLAAAGCFAAMLQHAISTRASLLAILGLTALLIPSAGLALASQAYLRWMLRNVRRR